MTLVGQNRKQLEKRRKKLNKEIKKVNSLLVSTEKKKTSALDDLKDINQKITIRERLIETIALEIEELDADNEKNERKINTYTLELLQLKEEYADLVFNSYKSKSQQSKTMFLLSSKSFYQAFKRIKYMEQYKTFRKKQGEAIKHKTTTIEHLNDSLIQKKNTKVRLIYEEEQQKNQIEDDKEDKVKLISKIKSDEQKYKSELNTKIKEEKAVSDKIDKIIREAIAKANKAKKGKANAGKLLLNKAEKSLKARFELNKGKLPWPVDGLITRKFGIQPHPTFKGININSTGLHIRAKKGESARSIFNGKVLAIHLLSKGRKAVLIQHGNYITAYNNLKEIYVRKGDPVKTGQKLGKIFTDKVSGKTNLVFILFKDTVRLNPSEWIDNK